MHSTAGEAALVAREAGVKLLALTHVSTRYFGHEVVAEARELFPDTVVPRDFDVVQIPFPERGARSSSAPGHVRIEMLDREFTAGPRTATTRRRIATLPRRPGLLACTMSECVARLGRDRLGLRVNSRPSI